jgi:hypothetical protein
VKALQQVYLKLFWNTLQGLPYKQPKIWKDTKAIYSTVGNLGRDQNIISNSETIRGEELALMTRCVGIVIGHFGVDKILNLV